MIWCDTSTSLINYFINYSNAVTHSFSVSIKLKGLLLIKLGRETLAMLYSCLVKVQILCVIVLQMITAQDIGEYIL